jgi:hypothetical protein
LLVIFFFINFIYLFTYQDIINGECKLITREFINSSFNHWLILRVITASHDDTQKPEQLQFTCEANVSAALNRSSNSTQPFKQVCNETLHELFILFYLHLKVD